MCSTLSMTMTERTCSECACGYFDTCSPLPQRELPRVLCMPVCHLHTLTHKLACNPHLECCGARCCHTACGPIPGKSAKVAEPNTSNRHGHHHKHHTHTRPSTRIRTAHAHKPSDETMNSYEWTRESFHELPVLYQLALTPATFVLIFVLVVVSRSSVCFVSPFSARHCASYGAQTGVGQTSISNAKYLPKMHTCLLHPRQ